MFLTEKKEVKKVFIPGYTGHVPHKKNLPPSVFIVESDIAKKGLVNKEAKITAGRHPGACSYLGQKNRNMSAGPNLKANHMKYGNWSKKAPNWICGPNYQIRYQHVPGYTCHVPGVKAENIFGKSYARTTATANSNKRFNRNVGQIPKSIERHQAHSENEFRRFLDAPELKQNKDYQDYSASLNREKYNEKNKILYQAPARTVGTICSKTGTDFFNNQGMRTKRLMSPKVSQDMSSIKASTIKPKLLESNIVNEKRFFNMSDGFQRIFTNDAKDAQMTVPISGYKGHKRGDKSQNFFGKSFRECAIQSRKLERSLQRR
ncbi:unnamed protein product [Moneuplotes crassus]|uniref:Uncharacterized protein n=1 Tax=Euplotes crassus TaxID=5936 RepID=A0AAD1UMS8_EUPCR|nr:unnamed protein product [Moneuplotes crassus]